MSSTLYEIVELDDGEIVLRRATDDSDPLVTISFSDEALYFLNDSKFLVAKAMIEAGLEVATDVDDQGHEGLDALDESDENSTIH